jgi:uncharacterized protein (DUF2267 family)
VAATIGVMAAGAWLARLLWPQLPQARRALQRGVRRLPGGFARLRYLATTGAPDPWVRDDVLAERIRAELGPLEHRLDVPTVDVEVHGHVATLRGSVPTVTDAHELEAAAEAVSGIFGVESHLEVGLASAMRPSAGGAHPGPSPARRRLLAAAERAGVPADEAATAVCAVLSPFAGRIPAGERAHLLLHLPDDVRRLAIAPAPIGGPPAPRTVAELLERSAAFGLRGPTAPLAAESILAELRALVPEEVDDVAAVLPRELRDLWISAVPA